MVKVDFHRPEGCEVEQIPELCGFKLDANVRPQVTLLFPLFRGTEQSAQTQDGQPDANLILNDVNDYNRRFSGQPRSVSLHVFT